MTRHVCTFVLWAVCLSATTSAARAQAPVQAAVMRATGDADARVRVSVVRALAARDEVALTAVSRVDSAARRLGVSLEDADGRRAVAQDLGLDALVGVSGALDGRQIVVTAVVFDADGDEVDTFEVGPLPVRTARRTMQRQLWDELGPALLSQRSEGPEPTSPPRPERAAAPEPAPQPAEASEEPARPRSRSAGDLLTLHGAMGISGRRLTFTDDLFDTIGEYRLGAVISFAIGGTLFPLRASFDSAIAHLGVEAFASRLTVRDTENQGGARFESQAWAWFTGLRYEYPFERGHHVFAAAGVGRERFRVEPAGPATPGGLTTSGVPSVTYTFVRLAAGARVVIFGPIAVSARAGWRPILDAGPIANADWFPNARGNGFEFGGYVGVRVHPLLELQLDVEHRRYVMHLRPEPGDPHIAGGSLDAWLDVQLRAVFTLPAAL